MPQTEAVANWRLLENEIVLALRLYGAQIEKNALGDPCINGEVNIAVLARLMEKRVLVKVTPVGWKV